MGMSVRAVLFCKISALTPSPEDSVFSITNVWSQLVNSFKDGMPLQKKRWGLKSYDKCFSGTEAVEWLHTYLQKQPMFSENATRERTRMLLQKLLDGNFIQGIVRGKCNDFMDSNSNLYRFASSDEIFATSYKAEKCTRRYADFLRHWSNR